MGILWQEEVRGTVSGLFLKEEIEGIAPGDLRFFVLKGSGAGDLYLFQGNLDLGEGKKLYNLMLAGYEDQLWMYLYRVEELCNGRMYPVSKPVVEKGILLARKLARTLPEDFFRFCHHNTTAIIKGWNLAMETTGFLVTV